MYKPLNPPVNFQLNRGDSIHTSNDPNPHLSGSLNGNQAHINYYGQTTLGMFDTNLPGHRLNDVNNLHQQFPSTFNNSGLNWQNPKFK